LHFQDSLGREISALKKEKTQLEGGGDNTALLLIKTDSVVKKEEKKAPPPGENEKPPTAGKSLAKQDTVVIAEVKPKARNDEPPVSNNKTEVVVIAPGDKPLKPPVVKPVSKARAVYEAPVVQEPPHWKVARALDPIAENAFPHDIFETT